MYGKMEMPYGVSVAGYKVLEILHRHSIPRSQFGERSGALELRFRAHSVVPRADESAI
jgi:hypothetical protein